MLKIGANVSVDDLRGMMPARGIRMYKITSSRRQTFKQTVTEASIRLEARPNVLANKALQGSHESNFRDICLLCLSDMLPNETFQRRPFEWPATAE